MPEWIQFVFSTEATLSLSYLVLKWKSGILKKSASYGTAETCQHSRDFISLLHFLVLVYSQYEGNIILSIHNATDDQERTRRCVIFPKVLFGRPGPTPEGYLVK